MTVAPHAQPLHAGRARIAVLFLHGFNSTPHSLREWATLTAHAGYRVALPRLPGHGTDWRELNTTRWQDWYFAAERELRELSTTCDQVFIAGHSMGGALALRLAEHHPAVAGLALVNPGMLATRAQRLAPIASRVVRTVPSTGRLAAEPGPGDGYHRLPLRSAASMVSMFADIRAGLDLVTCPLLVFRSADADVVVWSSSEYVRSFVSSEEITVRELPRNPPGATVELDRELVYAETLAFIATHSH